MASNAVGLTVESHYTPSVGVNYKRVVISECSGESSTHTFVMVAHCSYQESKAVSTGSASPRYLRVYEYPAGAVRGTRMVPGSGMCVCVWMGGGSD